MTVDATLAQGMTVVDGAVEGAALQAEAATFAFPRRAGSEGDRRIIRMLVERLSGLGLEVSSEELSYDIRPAEWALRVVLVAGGLLLAAAAWTAGPMPWLAAGLLVVAVAPSVLFLAWAPWLERLYRRQGRTRTANVVARRPAARPRLTLVVMAHHDSKSQSLILPLRTLCTLLALAGASTVAVVVGLTLAGGGPVSPWPARGTGVVAAAAALALASMRSSDRSPGGVDNAGSLAILVALAAILPRVLPEEVELLLLATGAEEDHMVGAMRWLEVHAAELAGRPTYCLNLDGAGSPGRLALLERYGFGRPFSPRMSAAARRAARRLGLEVRGVLTPPGMGVDAIPFAHRGIPCLTLASGSLGPATMSVHSARDTADHLDAATLEAAARLALETLVELTRTGTPS